MDFTVQDSLPCCSLQGTHHLVMDFDAANGLLRAVNYGMNGNRSKIRDGYAAKVTIGSTTNMIRSEE